MILRTFTKITLLLFCASIFLTPIAYGIVQNNEREIHVKVLWDKKPMDDMKIYLLNSDLNFIKKKLIKNKTGMEIKRQSFYDAYRYSTQDYLNFNDLSNKSERDKKVKILIKNMLENINLYRIGEDIPYFNGETYINVEAGERYYLVVLKEDEVYSEEKPFVFWMEEIFFPEGVYQEPKEIILTRSNAVIWK